MSLEKIIVVAHAGSISGGNECMHQFAKSIKDNGIRCHMYYYGEDREKIKKTQNFFAHYQVPVSSRLEDKENVLIILPEVLARLSDNFKESKVSIFWLSVDNFFPLRRKNLIRDFVNYFNIRRNRPSIRSLKHYIHLSQSSYSSSFLEKNGFKYYFIGDYINDDFVQESIKTERVKNQKNQVCFNPAKGKKFVKALMNVMPDTRFIPLINMSRNEVINTLAKSKIDIDFGHHPGKDRIPREAALMDCCIITSTRGSAGNDTDIPISGEYKFSVKQESLIGVKQKILEIFPNYDQHIKNFSFYKSKIINERKTFDSDVKDFCINLGLISKK